MIVGLGICVFYPCLCGQVPKGGRECWNIIQHSVQGERINDLYTATTGPASEYLLVDVYVSNPRKTL